MIDANVLNYPVWGFDESPYRVLANKMSVTRAPHECAICFEDIPTAARVRAQREVCEGQCKTFYFCQTCCEAMSEVHMDGRDPDGEGMDARYELGRINAERKRREARA